MRSARSKTPGFTLVEAIVAIGVMALVTMVGYAALSVLNRDAVLARLNTLATEMARSQIDQIATANPYNPANNQTPALLAVNSGSPTTVTQALYVDPSTGTTVINATMTTQIDSIDPVNGILGGTVTVAYTYHGKTYSVVMYTQRSPDE